MEQIGVVPNIYNVMWLFNEYNKAYFGGVLPRPRFALVHDRRTLGKFTCGFDEENEVDDPEILISDCYEYTETRLRDILVHEMIHYYLAYTQQDVYITHGRAFKRLANEFNSKYGTNITKTVDTSDMRQVNYNKGNWFSRMFS
jgi:hypothetical protein